MSAALSNLLRPETTNRLLHKLPNADLIVELAIYWKPGILQITKIKSHQNFEDAKSLDQLWYMAGNYCADMAATSAFKVFPECVRDLAAEIAQFAQLEQTRLHGFFQYVACLNKERTKACADIKRNNADHSRNMNVPKQHEGNQDSIFPKDAMGQEAVEFAVHFAPNNFSPLGVFQIPRWNVFSLFTGTEFGTRIRAMGRTYLLASWCSTSRQDGLGNELVGAPFQFLHYDGLQYPDQDWWNRSKSQIHRLPQRWSDVTPQKQADGIFANPQLPQSAPKSSYNHRHSVFPSVWWIKVQVLTKTGSRMSCRRCSTTTNNPQSGANHSYSQTVHSGSEGICRVAWHNLHQRLETDSTVCNDSRDTITTTLERIRQTDEGQKEEPFGWGMTCS